jgi:hypothetical protein
VTPDILLYLALGVAASVLAWRGFRRRQPDVRPTADTSSLTAPVRSQVARDFEPGERTEVELLLAQYGTSEPETERVRLAILHVAKGKKAEVARHLSSALLDYRDVLYAAYYYDDDPHRLLRELLTQLEKSRLLTRDEAHAVLRATRGTLYRDAFEKLCEIMVKKETPLTRDAYQRVERLGKIVNQPAHLWAPLEKNVT